MLNGLNNQIIWVIIQINNEQSDQNQNHQCKETTFCSQNQIIDQQLQTKQGHRLAQHKHTTTQIIETKMTLKSH